MLQIVLILIPKISFADDQLERNNITKNLRCLICQGQSVYDSDSEFATSLKMVVKNQIEQFDDCKQIPLHFVGSIGFYLKDELEKVLKKNNLKLGKVLKRPIEGLVNYHLKNI